MRNKFDALKANYKTNDELRNQLICHLLYFYDIDQDGQRLVSDKSLFQVRFLKAMTKRGFDMMYQDLSY